MKKKLLSVLLLACMMFIVAACGKKNDTGVKTEDTVKTTDETKTDAEPTEAPATEPSGQIIIGSTTELSGDWVPYFQNNAADYDVFKMVIDEYNTVDMTSAGEFVVNNTAVKDYKTTENEDGSKTYTWTINDNLVWNDGTPIKAIDYVTTAMLWSSNVVGEMGATNDFGKYLKGYNEFAKGTAKEFAGVNLIDEHTFALTIAADKLPYFYELLTAGSYPTKLSFWTDEAVTITDDGNGCYFSDNFTKEAYEGKINAARKALPRITCGYYNITSYDEASKTAVLDINPNYLGNYEGQKPSIKTIIYKNVTKETALDELSTGAVDLLAQMSSGDEINGGLDLVDQGGFAFSSYDRAGYGKLQMICDFGPTQFVEVRQAIAHLLDRNDFAKAFTGGFGSVVNGPFGEAMWFYQETKDELDQNLNQYAYSLDEAIRLLEEGGWVYDKDGKEYTSGIRYKKLEDGTLMPLIIEWASSENNPVSELLVVKLQENPDLAAAGIQINQTVMTFTELLNYIYRDGSTDPKYGVPTYGLFNLGTGFTPQYDLSSQYTTDPELYEQGYNDNFIKDEKLDKLAQEMVLSAPEDREGFKQKFVAFIERWNELLPDLPLYSNIYHDFYNAKLENYNPNAIWEMSEALLYSNVTE